jgi:hypothetical protein
MQPTFIISLAYVGKNISNRLIRREGSTSSLLIGWRLIHTALTLHCGEKHWLLLLTTALSTASWPARAQKSALRRFKHQRKSDRLGSSLPLPESRGEAEMGTFAETANVDYRSSFVNQGEQTSVFRIYIYTYMYTHKHTYIYICIYIYIFPFAAYWNIYVCCRFKRKNRRFSLVRLPFARRVYRSLSFVRLMV